MQLTGETGVKLVLLLMVYAMGAPLAGCARKPAYANINVNASRPSREPQASAEQPAGGSPAASTDAVPGAGAQPKPQEPAAPPPFKMPAFLDTQKGEVKDLPSYPEGQRLSIQYGPVSGGEMASLVLATSSSIDNIAAFYEKAIKSNRWEVTVRNRDSEYAEWRLKKGDKEEGSVTVRRDPEQQRGMIIQISRSSKLDEQK